MFQKYVEYIINNNTKEQGRKIIGKNRTWAGQSAWPELGIGPSES